MSQSEISVRFTKACLSQEDPDHDAEGWGRGLQLGAWDAPEWKLGQ